MSNNFPQGPSIQYSVNKLYRIDTQSVVNKNGVNYHAATILKSIRSYWQPVLAGINLLDSEIESYLTENVK